MKRSSLASQLAIYVVVSTLLTLGVGLGLYFQLSSARKSSAASLAELKTSKDALFGLLELASQTNARLSNTVRLKDPDEIEAAVAALDKNHAEILARIEQGAGEDGGLKQAYQPFKDASRKTLEFFLLGQSSQAFEHLIVVAGPAHDAFLRSLQEYGNEANRRIEAAQAADGAVLDRRLHATGAATAAALVLLAAYGWLFRHRALRRLHEVAESVDQVTALVRSHSGEVSELSESLSRDACSQAAALEETSASLNEIGSLAKTNHDQSHAAVRLASEARAAANEGSARIEELRRAMDEIQASSTAIESILKDIDQIAFQTNILALNAAVEAARAGAAGAGFAVVAEEVRALAQRSASSARDTASRIEDSIGKTRRGVELGGQVFQSFATITDHAGKVDDLIRQISCAIEEQSKGIVQVNGAVNQIDKLVQTGAAAAETGAASAAELRSQAEKLGVAVRTLHEVVGGGGCQPPRASSAKGGTDLIPAASRLAAPQGATT